MILAAPNDSGYQILLILHIIAAIIAFVPAIAHPVMRAQSKKSLDAGANNTLMGFMAVNSQRIYASALIVAGLLGFAMVGMSDSVYEMSEGWLITSIILWVVMVGVLHGVLVPAERRLAGGDTASEKVVQSGGMLLTVLGIVTIYLMVFQPGH